MPATREHLMMVLADLDDVLIRASYSTEMRSSSISDVSMEVAVPNYSGLAQALEVEQCRCPPGYQGLSCQVIHHPSQMADSSGGHPGCMCFIKTLPAASVCFRTVPLDTLAPEEVYTWVTVSSVNVTGTRTPATQRQASARYKA